MIIANGKGVMLEGNTSDILKELKSTIETVRTALANEYNTHVADNLLQNCYARATRSETKVVRY